MARPARFDPERILEATRELVVEHGPRAATMQSIARRMGGPTGSIYHRFSSRAELLARVWLEAVAAFQGALQDRVAKSDVTPASVARFVVEWARTHPDRARILLLHRSADFQVGSWPAPLVARAEGLREELSRLFGQLTRRWLGGRSRAHIDAVVLAVADLPQAALRRHLESGGPVPARLAAQVAVAAEAIIDASRSVGDA